MNMWHFAQGIPNFELCVNNLGINIAIIKKLVAINAIITFKGTLQLCGL